MPAFTTPTSSCRRRRAYGRPSRTRSRAHTSKRRGGLDFAFPRVNTVGLFGRDPFDHDPLFVQRPMLKFTMPHPTQMSTTCDANDPSCTSSSHSSYSYVQRDGKTNVVHKESFVRKRKNDEGKTVVERKKVDYETKDGKTVKDVFQHYEIDQDAKGKFVSIKDPAGKIVYKGYIDGKLSTRENAKHIAALIKRHRQTLEPSVHSGSSRAVVATGSKRDNESATLASMVQNELDGTMHEQTRSGSGETSATRSPSRRASSSRKRSRSSSSSSSSETSSAHRHSRRASSSRKKSRSSLRAKQ